MNYIENALTLLPGWIRDNAVKGILPYSIEHAEEIRLRMGQLASFAVAGRVFSFSSCAVTERDMNCVIERATGASLHSFLSQLAEGYIYSRGLRIGVCGEAAVQNGEISGFRRFTSLNIRIPHEFEGDFDTVYARLFRKTGTSVLVLAPPGVGKTTVLRELIRRLSYSGINISIVDERGELTAGYPGESGFDLGANTDILSGVKKSRAAIMMLRTMSPKYIALDEITDSEDIHAVREISGCGVSLLATAHASSYDDLNRRGVYRELLKDGIFDYAVEIHFHSGKREYTERRLNE